MFANTKKQSLVNHLIATAKISELLSIQITSDKNIHRASYVAGLLHDIGKVDPEFQNWVIKSDIEDLDNGQHIDKGKFTFEKHARHNEISSYISYFLIGTDRFSKKEFLSKFNFTNHDFSWIDIIQNAIFWHHPKPLRKDALEDMESIFNKSLKEDLESYLENMNNIFFNMNIDFKFDLNDDLYELIDDINSQKLPDYKKYRNDSENFDDYVKDIRVNAISNIVRSIVITADRIVSSLSVDELNSSVENDSYEDLLHLNTKSILTGEIEKHSSSFFPDSDRTNAQIQAAKLLSVRDGIAVLSGAAGCGKTKIGIEWAKIKKAQKLYWVVPRVSVGQSIFEELSSDDYLPNVNIELFTGEYKLTKRNGVISDTLEDDHLSGDVVITTIDQIVNGISTNNNIGIFIDFMNSFAVFDEYHEYVQMDSFNLLFSEIIECKKKFDESKTLLISATPNYLFVEKMLGVDIDDIVEMKSSNMSKYEIKIEEFNDKTLGEDNPLLKAVEDDTIVITNTAKLAQEGFILNINENNSRLFHSKLASNDKKVLFDEIYSSLKKNGTRDVKILRAGPIVQASLNITCFNMISEASSAENLLQRLGRLDRFGESNKKNVFTIAVSESISSIKIIDNSGRFLNQIHSFQNCAQWISFLKEKDLSELTISELYDFYKEFYSRGVIKKLLSEEILKSFKKSVETINCKVTDPLWIKPKFKDLEKKLKKSSLRGDSRYVQLASIKIIDSGPILLDNYVISEDNQLTLSVSEFGGDDSPLSFMMKKHHQIYTENKKPYSSSVLKDAARSIENPIYCSYIPSDLKLVNESSQDSFIYYVVSDKQPIGCMKKSHIDSIFN